MKWRVKAAMQRACAAVPVARQALYRQLQRHCGGLVRGYDYRFLLGEAARMARALREHGFDLEGTTILEVGTGWRVDMPLGLFLCGARKIITCDLHRYFIADLALRTVQYAAANRDFIRSEFSFVDRDLLERRVDALSHVTNANELFRTTGIEYHAPRDCAATPFASGSIDLHYSYTVFEHIAAPVLESILSEANRLLSPRGLAYHHIDLGDHFAQVDPAITPANFLQFSQREWAHYASTPWSYHNRLREDDYRALYARVPQRIVDWKSHVDARSLEALRNGLPLDAEFRGKPLEMLSVAIADVISRPGR